MRSITELSLVAILAVAFCGCAFAPADAEDEASDTSEDELTANGSPWWNANPAIKIGSASVNVKDTGARGNGSHDDTAAIQKAIDSLPATGGTVVVPPGTYMIDALESVNMRSHVRLMLSDGAKLVAIPNGAIRYAVVKATGVDDIEITGGEVVGERDHHTGTKGEWGYGIDLLGVTKAFVHDIKLSKCWGDGILIGPHRSRTGKVPSSYVTLNRVESTGNRRQGLSVVPAHHIYVVNSAFTDTSGTLPQAGIDLEPQNEGSTEYVRIENTVLSGNKGNGLEVHNNVSHLQVVSSTLESNHGFGIYAGSPFSSAVRNSTLEKNGLAGVRLSATTHDFKVLDNSIRFNSTRYISPTRPGGGLDRDFSKSDKTYNITLKGNTFTN